MRNIYVRYYEFWPVVLEKMMFKGFSFSTGGHFSAEENYLFYTVCMGRSHYEEHFYIKLS